MDTLNVQIEDDGTITVTTDKVSEQNHFKADEFLDELEKLAGGVRTSVKRTDVKAHTHKHDHVHA